MTITEFLEARIAEDEALARAATPGPWEWGAETSEWGDCGPNLETVAKLPPYSDGSIGPVETVIGSWGHDANGITVADGDKAHIARHDPSRVLAECAAKRAIIKSYQSCVYAEAATDITKEFGVKLTVSGMVKGLELAIKSLATTYRDHADYQEDWATQ